MWGTEKKTKYKEIETYLNHWWECKFFKLFKEQHEKVEDAHFL